MFNVIKVANHKFETDQVHLNIKSKIIFDTHNYNIDDAQEANRYLAKNLYFITIQLKSNFSSNAYTAKRQQMTLNAIDDFYKWLSSRFIRRSQGRNSKYQPFLQLFLDNENSRYCDLKGPISTPHFHGLLLFHPKTVVCFERFLRESSPMNPFPTEVVLRTPAFYPLETVTFSRFDPETGPLDNLISYTTKFARNQRFASGNEEGIKLLTIHPQTSSKFYPFYKSKGCKVFGEYIY